MQSVIEVVICDLVNEFRAEIAMTGGVMKVRKFEFIYQNIYTKFLHK